MEGLKAPVDRGTRALLRRAVFDLASDPRRVYPPALHVGIPGARTASIGLDEVEPADPGLRADVVAALRVNAGHTPEGLVWLTRIGDLALQDVEARWLAAARTAYAEAGAPLTFVVVNRHGWRDPRSGVGRTWVRVRPQS